MPDKVIIPDGYWTGNGLLENECPWLTPGAIARLEELDLSNSTVLEFGAGGSTLFFARRAKYVFSVELPGVWLDKVSMEITRKNISNVKLVWSIDNLDPNVHYDLILIDNGGNRREVIEWVMKHDLSGITVIIDNYGRYSIFPRDGRVELFDDPHWAGYGTMIIYF